jgi:hypothetical protein
VDHYLFICRQNHKLAHDSFGAQKDFGFFFARTKGYLSTTYVM